MKTKKLFLLDIMPLLYRAHFATMGKKFGTTTGIDTRTTLVFFNYIFQVLTEEKPDAVAAALDSVAKQRVAVATNYKANREKMPTEISEAFPYAMQLLESLQIPVLKEEGYEADDIIASLAKKGAAKGYEVYIVSPDKDFAQLVNERIFLFRPAYKGAVMETLDAVGVKNKYGVEPHQIADFLALRGDSVDNIIGIKGIGDKTAASLLAEYHSVEELIESTANIKQQKVRESIAASKDQLIENKQLAVLTGALDINVAWDELKVKKPNEEKLMPLLDELQFEKMKERLTRLKFIKTTKAVNETVETIQASVIEIDVDAVVDKINNANQVSVGFDPAIENKLFITLNTEVDIYAITITDQKEWKKLITAIDKEHIIKIGWQLKPLLKKLIAIDFVPTSDWIDLSLAAYLLEPDAKIEWQYIVDKYGLKQYITNAGYSSINYLPSIADGYEKIISKMEEMELKKLFFEIELPLQWTIARMEHYGLRIDLGALDEIDKVLSEQLNELEQRLYELAGTKFNIGSPSQVAEILQKIAEPGELKKTKTGQISTAEPFLIDIAPKYPFVADLLNYRKLNKIITTYVYSLPKYIDPTTNKIHPTFQQVVAGTGRLSCTEPNLQNLPIRSEAGREVRKAVVPSQEGFSILSIDYNQVELRLLAALSEDNVMVETFSSGKDIHATTASRVFKVAENEITKDMRSKAKGINFGIAYGITPWGLSTRLKISQKEAKQIIDSYFEEFPSVKAYLERSVEETRAIGFTRTKYGRIRYIEGIDSRNGTTRRMAERMAVNAPLQGLAADIIKEAMVNVDRYITSNKLRSRLILQVHDELVFDAADDELKTLVPAVVNLMESKANFMVPLKVNVTVGKNWLDQEEYK